MSAPIITQITPPSGPTTGGTTVAITGSNLASPTEVTFGSTIATINSSTATSINVTIPAHSAGTARLAVTTADGTSTQAVDFIYETINTIAPVITSLSSTSGPASGGNTVTINGTGLLYTTGVNFGATPASSFAALSNTQVAAVAPGGTAGATTISVTNPAGTSNTLPYTIVISIPVVSSVSPTRGPIAGGNTAIIIGQGFLFAKGVTFGSTRATSFTVVSDTLINAVVPPGPNTGGNVSVRVIGFWGTSEPSATYTYVAAPVVNSVSPSSGPVAGGNTVIISGSGLTNATAVRFGSISSTSFTVLSDTSINAVVPPGPGAGGSVDVLVTGPGGTSAPGITYTYTAAPTPTITGLTPASGPVLGGNAVSITGTNLNGATAVTFAGTPASFTVLSPTQINAIAPASTAGAAPVVVTTPAGASAGFSYTYIAAPTPTAVFPTAGITAGGDTVVITGTGLTGTTSVNFGTTPATNFTVVNDTEVDVVTPLHATGTVPVSITTPGGTDSSLNFTFQPAPIISTISPASGPIAGGTVVTITGTGLINTLDVSFGTTPATFTVNSDTSVTATSPARGAGASAVRVTTAAATSNGAIFLYVAAPALTGLSPTGGPIVGGNNVTLTGMGFSTATQVFFGANLAAFTILSDTLLSAVAPSGTGAVLVTVVNPGGTSDPQTYTYA